MEKLALLATVLGLLRTAHGQCIVGIPLVYTAVDTYTVFTSPNYPSGYHNNLHCQWRIEADNATDAIRIEITDASIEFHADCVYDFGEVFDGYNSSADSLGKFCGTQTPSYVSTGNYAFFTFKSDYSMSLRGFKARFKSGDRESLLDKAEDNNASNMVFILAVAGGGFLLLVIIMVIFITCVQAKKAKRTRRRLRRGHSTRVQPFDNGNVWSTLDVPAPPAYGEVYSSPMSPPPEYSEMDPNPDQSEPLPARPQYMDDRRAARQVTHVIQVHRNQGIPSSAQPSLSAPSTREATNASAASVRTSQLSPRTQRGVSIIVPPNSSNFNNKTVKSTNDQNEMGGLPNATDTSNLIGNVAPIATESAPSGTIRPTMAQNNSTVTSRNTRMRGGGSNISNLNSVNQTNTRGTPRGQGTRGGRGLRSGLTPRTPRTTATVNTPRDTAAVTNTALASSRTEVSRNINIRGRGASNARRNPPRLGTNNGNNNANVVETNVDQPLGTQTNPNQTVPVHVRSLTQPAVVGNTEVVDTNATADNGRQLPPAELATRATRSGDQRRESDSDVSVVSLPDSDGSMSISASCYDSDNDGNELDNTV